MNHRYSDEELVWRKKFGDKLKRMIHIKGMTQTQVANELGVDTAIVSRYVTGTFCPAPYRILQLASILDCDVNCLYDVES